MGEASSLGHVPAGELWQFDDSVTRVFEDMLQRSIPQYFTMRELCYKLGKRFLLPGTDVIDLGCSRGQSVSAFVMHHPECRFLLIERSPPMLAAAREAYKDASNVSVLDLDLRTNYPEGANASLTLSILTLQFTPIEHRQRIMRHVYEATRPGGAFILVEKLLGSTAEIDDLFVNAYLDLKRQNLYSEDEIQRKKMSLEGVLVPVTAQWNEELLRSAGFTQVDCFWRWANFAGFLAIRG